MARDAAQRNVLIPVWPADDQRGVVDADGRRVEVDAEVARAAGRQVALGRVEREHALTPALGEVDVLVLTGCPELDRRRLRRAGRDRGVHPVGECPDGEEWRHLRPGEVRRVHRVSPHEELGGAVAVADPHEGRCGVLAQVDLPVIPAAGCTGGGAAHIGAARPVVVHPQGHGRAELRRRGVGAPTALGIRRKARIGAGVRSGLGVRVEVGGEPRNRRKAPVDPLQVGEYEQLLRRGQRAPGAGQAHGADPFDLPVAVHGGQARRAEGIRGSHAPAGPDVARRREDVARGRLWRDDGRARSIGLGERERCRRCDRHADGHMFDKAHATTSTTPGKKLSDPGALERSNLPPASATTAWWLCDPHGEMSQTAERRDQAAAKR